MRKLIINADDYGLSDGICQAINKLFDAKAISSTTMMLAAEGAVDRCRKWNVKRYVGKVGVHLQLTSGRPILPGIKIPGIINQTTGNFRPKTELANLDLEDVEREWRAQIELAHKILNDKPSHIDSHHGAHHLDGLAEVFIKLALEFNLPIRDCILMREFKTGVELFGSDVVIYEWTGLGLSDVELKHEIHKALNNSRDNDILELVTHPGFSSAELKNISTLNDLREKDYASLLNIKKEQWLKLEGIQLISFSEIHKK